MTDLRRRLARLEETAAGRQDAPRDGPLLVLPPCWREVPLEPARPNPATVVPTWRSPPLHIRTPIARTTSGDPTPFWCE